VAAQLAASQEGLSSVDLVSYIGTPRHSPLEQEINRCQDTQMPIVAIITQINRVYSYATV
jgi:hypothetical protein